MNPQRGYKPIGITDLALWTSIYMKTIWTIVGGLVAMMILSLVMIFVMLAHLPASRQSKPAMPAARMPCHCTDRCCLKAATK
jgi:hypothetical protein